MFSGASGPQKFDTGAKRANNEIWPELCNYLE